MPIVLDHHDLDARQPRVKVSAGRQAPFGHAVSRHAKGEDHPVWATGMVGCQFAEGQNFKGFS